MVHQSKRAIIDLTKSNSTGMEDVDGKYHYVPFGEKFIVHPGRFVLGSTLEWLRFPNNIGGYITGKSSLGRRGLIIETAAGVQPGFCGTLTLEIANVGEVPIAITPGMRVAQIFFHELCGDEATSVSKYSGRRRPILADTIRCPSSIGPPAKYATVGPRLIYTPSYVNIMDCQLIHAWRHCAIAWAGASSYCAPSQSLGGAASGTHSLLSSTGKRSATRGSMP